MHCGSKRTMQSVSNARLVSHEMRVSGTEVGPQLYGEPNVQILMPTCYICFKKKKCSLAAVFLIPQPSLATHRRASVWQGRPLRLLLAIDILGLRHRCRAGVGAERNPGRVRRSCSCRRLPAKCLPRLDAYGIVSHLSKQK